MSRPVTPQDVQRVHAHECSQRGHSYGELIAAESVVPTGLICSHCGDQRAVVSAFKATTEDLIRSDPQDLVDWLRSKGVPIQLVPWS